MGCVIAVPSFQVKPVHPLPVYLPVVMRKLELIEVATSVVPESQH
jgi:hypothetical protein